LTIQHVRLAAGNVMDMLSIDQMDVNATRFQDLKQWYPVHPGGFHSHRVHTALLQPVRQGVQALGKGGKRSNRFCIAIGGDGGENLRRSNINTAGIRSHHRQTPVQLTMLPFLCLCHGSSPLMKFGNEPGVQKMEIYQAGSSQHNQRLRVTNVIAHGPGIKLLYGLAEASTTGDTTYAYRCRVRFLRPHPGQYWTRSQQWKVPYCYCLAAGQFGYSSARSGIRHPVNRIGPI